MPARLRSFFDFARSRIGAPQRADPIEARLAAIEDGIASLKALIRARDDRAQRKLKGGLSSILNFMAILPQLRINGVIPPFPHQGFEITGEEAAFLYHLIRRHRPKLVMELGSGSSTFLLAAAVRANGSGRVVTVEHDPDHARQTMQYIEQAALGDWVELVQAPLVPLPIGERTFHWYDLGPLLSTLSERIDLVFVDGPPGKMQSLSRYPALPVLGPHLSPHALVFIDDGGREDETRMVELWRGLDGAGFEIEPLGFLPRAPVLLKFGAPEARIAELRLARDDRGAQEEEQTAAQARRINVF